MFVSSSFNRDSRGSSINLISLNGSKLVNPAKTNTNRQDSKYGVVHIFHPHPLLCSVHSDSICTSGKTIKKRQRPCGFQRPELKEKTMSPSPKVFDSLNDKELCMLPFCTLQNEKDRKKKQHIHMFLWNMPAWHLLRDRKKLPLNHQKTYLKWLFMTIQPPCFLNAKIHKA